MAAARTFPQPARRVAIGIKRVSLLKQVDNYSFDGQGNKFAKLAQTWDCDIPNELMIEDKGYSGTDFNRPSIKKALGMIQAGVANAVAFPWVDRFAREVEGGLATIRLFLEAGADVLLGDLGWYRDEGNFRLQMNTFLAIAMYQRDDIAEKSKYGVQAKLERGLAHFGAAYGWHMVTALEIAARAVAANQPVPLGRPKNFYERRLDELDVVLLMGELALAGGREGSLRGICRELDARGIKTPSGKIGWNAMSVRTIMNDEVYSTGIWHYGKRKYVAPKKIRKPDAERHKVRTVAKMRPRDEWDHKTVGLPGGPIWTPEEHAAILEAVERNGKVSAGKPARAGGRAGLLNGLCTCGATVTEGERQGHECGMSIAPWQSSRVKDDGTRSVWYRCTHRHRTLNHHLCDGMSVKADALERGVWEATAKLVCEDLESMIAEKYREIVTEEDANVLSTLRDEYKRKTAKRKEAMRRQIEADDADDKAEYAGLVVKYKAELALLDRRIEMAASDTETEQLDIKSVQDDAREVFYAPELTAADKRAILLTWVQGVRYANGWATITVKVRIGVVNCKQPESHVYNKHLLLTTRIQVAA